MVVVRIFISLGHRRFANVSLLFLNRCVSEVFESEFRAAMSLRDSISSLCPAQQDPRGDAGPSDSMLVDAFRLLLMMINNTIATARSPNCEGACAKFPFFTF